MSGVITVLGLGAGELDQLTMGVYKKIKEASHMYVRTKEHPVIEELEKEGIQYTAFDHIYEAHDTFEIVYETIVKRTARKSAKYGNYLCGTRSSACCRKNRSITIRKGKTRAS